MTTNSEYQEFLLSKHAKIDYVGFDVNPDEIISHAFRYQRDCIRWSIKLGRSALFQQVGMGKTLQAAEISRLVAQYTGGKVLTLAPLGVTKQSRGEYSTHSNIDMPYVWNQTQVIDNEIVITNYQRLVDKQGTWNFDPNSFAMVVLDEGSILKSYMGETKKLLMTMFKNTPYKLICSATPAPNDYMELLNHAQWLGLIDSNEALGKWFVADGSKAGKYRLKKHAEDDFWRWVTTWAVCISRPSDLGDEYADEDSLFSLPPLIIKEHFVGANKESIQEAWQTGKLLPDVKPSSTQLGHAKTLSLPERLEIVNRILRDIPVDEPILIWCEQDNEADALKQVVAEFTNDNPSLFKCEYTEVRGSHSIEKKEAGLDGFTKGDIRILITKGRIAGYGLNWQHCNQVIDFSPNFSYEMFWQKKGRNHRFGQKRAVTYNIVYAEIFGNVMDTLRRKEKQYIKMQEKMNEAMHKNGLFRDRNMYQLKVAQNEVHRGKNFELHLGDSVELIKQLADNSVHIVGGSPPYSLLYTYSDNMADMGNANNDMEFFEHFRYLVRDINRVLMPGRLVFWHVKDLPLYKNAGNWFGVKNFSDEVTRLHLEEGFIFHSRITIWKSPVEEMEKTNSHGLLHKNFVQRSQVNRVGLPDYLMVYVKPDPQNMGKNVEHNPFNMYQYIGDNPPRDWERETRSKKPRFYKGEIEEYSNSIAVWQRYASPVWFDIRHTNVLNFEIAKGNRDERHIAPMSLDLYGRALQLWSNPQELMLEPFAGIGSGIAAALHLKRRAIGFELKKDYYDWACKFAQEAERDSNQRSLFDLLPEGTMGD